MSKTVSIIVSGKVQGVYFRQTTKETALSLGISGHVRNLADGSVHILATGEPAIIERLIRWCHEGPPRARVTHVVVEEMPLTSFDQFRIVR